MLQLTWHTQYVSYAVHVTCHGRMLKNWQQKRETALSRLCLEHMKSVGVTAAFIAMYNGDDCLELCEQKYNSTTEP